MIHRLDRCGILLVCSDCLKLYSFESCLGFSAIAGLDFAVLAALPLLAQYEFLDLAGARQGVFIYFEPELRGLLWRQVLSQVSEQHVLIYDFTGGRPKKSTDFFTHTITWQPDYRNISHGRVLEQ